MLSPVKMHLYTKNVYIYTVSALSSLLVLLRFHVYAHFPAASQCIYLHATDAHAKYQPVYVSEMQQNHQLKRDQGAQTCYYQDFQTCQAQDHCVDNSRPLLVSKRIDRTRLRRPRLRYTRRSKRRICFHLISPLYMCPEFLPQNARRVC